MSTMPTIQQRRRLPLPEVLDAGTPYTIRPTESSKGLVCTDIAGRIMYAPTSDTPMARMGRLHELAHVAISPSDAIEQATARGIGHDYINVTEDWRINDYLHNNFEISRSVPERELSHTIEGFDISGNLRDAIMLLACTRGLPEYEVIRAALKPEWRREADGVIYALDNLYDRTFESVLRMAEYLQGLFVDGGALSPEALAELDEQARIDAIESLLPTIEGIWGDMEINRPNLPIALGARRTGRRMRPRDMGDTLLFPSRLDDDGRAFGRVVRTRGGTILIDVSGSMSIVPADVAELVNKAPSATVAVYSGSNRCGHLTIIASKGRMLDLDAAHWPAGNIVDGPALRWLAKQPKPRIWVCDGHVTGQGDQGSVNLTIEANQIVRAGRITRFERLVEVNI